MVATAEVVVFGRDKGTRDSKSNSMVVVARIVGCELVRLCCGV